MYFNNTTKNKFTDLKKNVIKYFRSSMYHNFKNEYA